MVCVCVCANSMHIPGAADPGSVGNHGDQYFTMETTVTPFTRPPLLLPPSTLGPYTPTPPCSPSSCFFCSYTPMIRVDHQNTNQVCSLTLCSTHFHSLLLLSSSLPLSLLHSASYLCPSTFFSLSLVCSVHSETIIVCFQGSDFQLKLIHPPSKR